MKKFLTIAVAGVTAAVMAFSMAGDAAARDKIRIATEGAYPPFNMKDTAGNLIGFDVEIANAMCRYLKVECEIVAQDWDGIIPALLANKYDAIIASMSITEERKKRVAFTDKYYQTPARFVVEDGAIADFDLDGMKAAMDGKVVGVQSSTIHANFLEDNLDGVVEIRYYDTQEQANLDLAAGRVDALLADSIVLDESFLKTPDGEGYGMVGPALDGKVWAGFGEGVGVAIRKEDQDLVDMFNRAIKGIRENGEYLTIQSKYFDFDIYGG
ncbi:MAG: ABC transporter substrate-binding protein [Alphaproteobacteria bacterium]|nr:ABC transporter substrate-binding protein [Alphaproteobacteria bacterium SS10]